MSWRLVPNSKEVESPPSVEAYFEIYEFDSKNALSSKEPPGL
jgi:hypothetical protein